MKIGRITKKGFVKAIFLILIVSALATGGGFFIGLPLLGELEIEFEDFYHPIPGYDAEFKLKITENSVPMPYSLYNIDLPEGVRMENGMVIIPYETWSNTSQFEITVSSKMNQGKTKSLFYSPLKYNLTFNDDFDFYNNTKWTVFGDNWPGAPAAVTKENQFEIRDGALVLKTEKRVYVDQNITYNYTRDAISTADSFNQRLGLFTSRVKMPKDPGVITAFWLWIKYAIAGAGDYMLKLDGPEGKHCFEIDIFEYGPVFSQTGNAFWFSQHFYWGDGHKYHQNYSNFATTAKPMHEGFNEISLLWTNTSTALYVNGKMVYRLQVSSDNGNAAFMILSLYNGFSPDSWHGMAEDRYFPYEFLVDFTRVYQVG